MRNKIQGGFFIIFFVSILLVLPGTTQVQKLIIRVVVENANVRLEPNIQSEIIKKAPIGSVFDVENKKGEWYEIKFLSKIGSTLIGYIHEMFVDVISGPPVIKKEVKKEPEIKKEREIRKEPDIEEVQEYREEPARFSRFYVFFAGAFPFSSSSASTNWSDSWSYKYLDSVNESGSIDLDNKSKLPGFGGGIIYMFLHNIGVEARIDFMNGNTEAISDFNVSWTWAENVGGGTYEGDIEPYPSESRSFSVTPISINIHARFPSGSMFIPYVSGGFSLFSGSYKASAPMGDADSWDWKEGYKHYQTIDWFKYEYKIDQSIGGVGINVGAGISFRFGSKIMVALDARYFLGPKKNFTWELVRKTYQTESDYNFEATETQMNEHEELLQNNPVKISFSFPMISIGIVFGF